MGWGDTARIHDGWAGDPSVVAICAAADCPPVGARIVIERDGLGRYVARWAGGQVPLHVDVDRDANEHVTHEGVVGTVHRVRPVRPEPRREAYILSLAIDPANNPPARRVKRESDPVFENQGPARNDF